MPWEQAVLVENITFAAVPVDWTMKLQSSRKAAKSTPENDNPDSHKRVPAAVLKTKFPISKYKLAGA